MEMTGRGGGGGGEGGGKGVCVTLPPPFPIKMGSLRQIQLYKVDHFSFCFLCFCVFDLELFFVSRTQESNLERETQIEK